MFGESSPFRCDGVSERSALKLRIRRSAALAGEHGDHTCHKNVDCFRCIKSRHRISSSQQRQRRMEPIYNHNLLQIARRRHGRAHRRLRNLDLLFSFAPLNGRMLLERIQIRFDCCNSRRRFLSLHISRSPLHIATARVRRFRLINCINFRFIFD